MDYLNFYTILNYMSLINTIFLAILVLYSSYLIVLALFQRVVIKYTDLYKYKVNNLYISIFWACFYILVFILFFYILRIYNINTVVDLHEVYSSTRGVYTWFMTLHLTVIWRIYFILLFVLFLIICLLLMQNFYKYMIKHIFLLYFYFYEEKKAHISRYYLYRFLANIRDIGQENVIVYYLKRKLHKVTSYFHGKDLGYHELGYYNIFYILFLIIYFKRMNTIIVLSPLFFIIYDCIFNHYILSHVFYYLSNKRI